MAFKCRWNINNRSKAMNLRFSMKKKNLIRLHIFKKKCGNHVFNIFTRKFSDLINTKGQKCKILQLTMKRVKNALLTKVRTSSG